MYRLVQKIWKIWRCISLLSKDQLINGEFCFSFGTSYLVNKFSYARCSRAETEYCKQLYFILKFCKKNSWKALRTMHLCFTYECAWIKREYAMIFFRKFNFWNFDGCFLKLDSEHFGLNVNFKKETEVKRCNNNKWKKALTEMQTLCDGCSKAKPKISPPQTPSRGRRTAKI